MKSIPLGGLTGGVMALLIMLTVAFTLAALRLAEDGTASLRGPAEPTPVAAIDVHPPDLGITLCGYSLNVDAHDMQELAARYANTIRQGFVSFIRIAQRDGR